jgi:hypothetical protein
MNLKLRETMWAEMKPNCYGGAAGDKVLPRWDAYVDGDMESDDSRTLLRLSARTFPPGTKVVISEPLCPACGEGRSAIYPPPKRGPLFASKCECGFDWDAWTLDKYS